MKSTQPKKILVYSDDTGKEPIEDWLCSLKDIKTETRIRRRIDRIQQGNFGDHKALGGGIFEMRFFFSSGYRVYYAEDDNIIVLLLCGGDKSTQKTDIQKAKSYWQDYKRRFK